MEEYSEGDKKQHNNKTYFLLMLNMLRKTKIPEILKLKYD